ncbi:PIN domain-containing protein [Candidatus Saccharibacteria bacterium]|nr:PIN domain-containing protein [Candidatus Saccharibacteria bacterium]MBQ3445738.1 PIN domain-containing protein [Candidatus Saccharibacteria bacterium]
MSDSLDTCVLVSFITGTPPEQTEAVRKLLESGDTHNIADLALSETAHVLESRYFSSHQDVAALLKLFLGRYDKVLNYNRALIELVLPYYESHPALSFNDCCLAFYAELGRAEPLFTFDAKLARQHPSAKRL